MNIADQVLGGTLTHTEYNTHKNSNQNLITTSGQTLDSGNTNQLAIGIANYAAISTFYTESGSANAYVLSSIGAFKAPNAYTDGMLIRFRAGNANTGASTVNVATLGVKNIKKADGSTDPAAGDIPTDKDTWARYDGTNFRLIEFGAGDVADSNKIEINETSHGYSVGDWIRVDGVDTTATAQANSAANAEVIGVVVAVADVNNFTVQTGGYTDQLSGLTGNTLYFLDETTAGDMTSTEPSGDGEVSKPVFVALNSTSGFILQYRGVVINNIPDGQGDFRVYIDNNQDIPTGTDTKIQLNQEVFDTDGWFDNTTNYRYTPQVAGKYFFGLTVQSSELLSSPSDPWFAKIFKNGSEDSACFSKGENNESLSANCVAAIDMNGSTDYVEFYVRHAHGSNRQLSGTSNRTYAFGYLIKRS